MSAEAASPPSDRARVVTASWDGAQLWDGKTGAVLATLEGHQGSFRSVAFSPDGARIVTASRDNTARLWDGKTEAVLATRLVTDNQHVARRRTLSAHGPSPVRLRAVPVIMSDFPVDPCVHAGRGRLIL